MCVSFPLCSYVGCGGRELNENVTIRLFCKDIQKGFFGLADEKKI